MLAAIIEDNTEAGKYLTKILSENGYETIWYTNGKETLANIPAKYQPQVILMDINLPDISGIELTIKIKNDYPQTDIIMQTVNDTADILLNAIKAGASGYVLKGSSPTEILAAINLVREGGTFITGRLARKMLSEFDRNPPAATQEETQHLTPKEKEILNDIIRRKSYKEISEIHHISINTVNAHIKNIYKKLQVRSRCEINQKFG